MSDNHEALPVNDDPLEQLGNGEAWASSFDSFDANDPVLDLTLKSVRRYALRRQIAAALVACLLFLSGIVFERLVFGGDESKASQSPGASIASNARPPRGPQRPDGRSRQLQMSMDLKLRGDRLLSVDSDIAGALRSYREFLELTIDPRAREVDISDSWLLAALKSRP